MLSTDTKRTVFIDMLHKKNYMLIHLFNEKIEFYWLPVSFINDAMPNIGAHYRLQISYKLWQVFYCLCFLGYIKTGIDNIIKF